MVFMFYLEMEFNAIGWISLSRVNYEICDVSESGFYKT
jgi:hypothetical protein